MSGKEMVELLRGAGYGPRSYSGRAMFGKRCVAVELGQPSVAKQSSEIELGADLAAEAVEGEDWDLLTQLRQELRGTRSDQMGMGTVVYWPTLEWPEGEEEE